MFSKHQIIYPSYPRVLTGAGWNQIIDPLTFVPFWYNDDTGEACYARPKIIEERWIFVFELVCGDSVHCITKRFDSL